uniref:Myb-like domain-containing protein n=1 Tax=Mucochytrium quahogii TaxID=96639 RepID=A0A7S2SJH1_9STRA|mmetsp:Transcript_6799/g.15225  ORF Transcript_6799/g.15225 Transcript_6799/m.15225 type:complete len:284 (+) Transcript_6799:55-906(+)
MATNTGEVLHSNDSKSLWNYTLSPGWTEREVQVFRIALMKFGLGRWTDIVKSRCLPGKTVAQLNNQMQRMIGQQSTSEFTGLHIDPCKVFAENKDKEGRRKNNVLINMEDNPTKEEVARKRKANKELYGLSKEEIHELVIPVLRQEETSSVVIKSTLKHKASSRQAKYDRLRALQQQLQKLNSALRRVQHPEEASNDDMEVDTPEEETVAKKTKTKTAKKNKAPAKKRVKEKTQEELDMELAKRLQREEGGMEVEFSDDDEDFVEPQRKSKRGRTLKKRRARD